MTTPNQINTPIHVQDSDCDVDPDTMLCRSCGVDHSGTCPDCGGKGFHSEECWLESGTDSDLVTPSED